jgi:hypothetical protein
MNPLPEDPQPPTSFNSHFSNQAWVDPNGGSASNNPSFLDPSLRHLPLKSVTYPTPTWEIDDGRASFSSWNGGGGGTAWSDSEATGELMGMYAADLPSSETVAQL